MSVRRRAVVALLIVSGVGWLYVETAWRLVAEFVASVLSGGGYGRFCGGTGLAPLVQDVNGCSGYSYHYAFTLPELIVGTAILAAIVVGLARWVTAPLRQMTDAVTQLGPTNLAQRLRMDGRRSSDSRRLGDAIDRMLDRVSDGYDAQRRFAANASHELRTPLATQRALIEVSLGSALTPDQLALVTRQLLATNERNERLVDGLLTLAETERGLATSRAVHLDEIVAETVDLLRASAEERELTLRVESRPTTVTGERPLLERLVTNLVQNAIKYNHPGGSVDVSLADGVLRVANTGPTVPAEAVDGLFEPFRRLAGERLDHGGGVGLGLTIARSIVAAHEGSIVARPNPDGGLSIEVRLPG